MKKEQPSLFDLLLTTEISFRGLYGGVTKHELNLPPGNHLGVDTISRMSFSGHGASNA
jgi:hypothetical protein